MVRKIRIGRFRWVAALILLWVVPVVCQTAQSQADVEARVDSLLKQLSLEASETAVSEDRGRRLIESRLDELEKALSKGE